MPSFDVVSKVNKHELINAVDQANREVNTRFDFKDMNAKYEFSDNLITMIAPTDFQLRQMQDILNSKMTKRNIDIRALEYKTIQANGQEARQLINIRQGIDKELAKKIVKIIKDKKMKVQASIQGEQVRVISKKKDDLQTVIATLKEHKLGLPVQFENFRD